MALRVLMQQTKIEPVVGVRQEAARLVVPALQDMQGVTSEKGATRCTGNARFNA